MRLLALAGMLTVLVAAAHGQQGPSPSKGKTTASPPRMPGGSGPEVVVIQLKYVDASEVQNQLNTLFGQQGVRAVPVRENTLAISASGNTIEKVKELVKAIDVQQEAPNAPQGTGGAWCLQVVQMKGSQTDQDLPQVLQLLGGIRAAVDRQHEVVVLSGPDKTVQEAVKLLEQLSDLHARNPAEKPRARNYRVRVVWLANFPGKKEIARVAPQVPPDLKDVQTELAQMGIADLRLVSQSAVSTSGQQFEVEGVPPETWFTGGPGEARILLKGTFLTPVDDRIGVHLDLNVSNPNEPKSKLCQLSTNITTSSGHLIVLGVTPIAESTSVFVVQIVAQ
jgi:Bacterial type II/III secretion system short domain